MQALSAAAAAVREAGFLGWGIVGVGVAGAFAAVGVAVAAALRARSPQAGALRAMVVAATVLGATCAALGSAGVVQGRVRTDRAIAEAPDELRPVERARVRREGYLDARAAARLGLLGAALPLLAGVAGALVAARRREGEGDGEEAALGPRPGRGLAIGAALGAVASAGFAVAALVEPVPGRNAGGSRVARVILDQVEDVEGARDLPLLVSACRKLDAAIEEAGDTVDRALVPALPAVARRCVEERIQAAALLGDLGSVENALGVLGRSEMVKHDRGLERLVDDARDEVRKIVMAPRLLPDDAPFGVRVPSGAARAPGGPAVTFVNR